AGRDAGVVDQQPDVGRRGGRFGDLPRVGDVERERDDAVEVDGARIARGGVDLGRAALEQLLREVAADAAVGAGDQRGAAFDVHVRQRMHVPIRDSRRLISVCVMDVMADVLSIAGVRGTLGARIEAGERWGWWATGIPGAAFHAVTSGTAWLAPRGQAPRQLLPGDVVL